PLSSSSLLRSLDPFFIASVPQTLHSKRSISLVRAAPHFPLAPPIPPKLVVRIAPPAAPHTLSPSAPHQFRPTAAIPETILLQAPFPPSPPPIVPPATAHFRGHF